MHFPICKALVALLTVESITANSWFNYKSSYNKWHETELERWLSDNNIPYPTPYDRAKLEKLVKDNWQDNVVTPYKNWDSGQLQKYLNLQGDGNSASGTNKDDLVYHIQKTWTETADRANDAYASVRNWIFDTWTDSQLKKFADHNGIPVPQPRSRDSLLKVARENYQTVADKAGETFSYPGDWLFHTWSDSELKSWLDERGIPVYQGTKRNELIAKVRRNSRIASNVMLAWSSSLSSATHSATQTVADSLFDTWSDSDLKRFADERGIKVPQGSRRNEVLALLRRQNQILSAEASRLSASAASAYGAATSSAGNEFARATEDAALKLEGAQNYIVSYLDWFKSQVGWATSAADAKASEASRNVYSASKSAASVSKSASSAMSSASKAASQAAESAYGKAYGSGQKAKDYVNEEL